MDTSLKRWSNSSHSTKTGRFLKTFSILQGRNTFFILVAKRKIGAENSLKTRIHSAASEWKPQVIPRVETRWTLRAHWFEKWATFFFCVLFFPFGKKNRFRFRLTAFFADHKRWWPYLEKLGRTPVGPVNSDVHWRSTEAADVSKQATAVRRKNREKKIRTRRTRRKEEQNHLWLNGARLGGRKKRKKRVSLRLELASSRPLLLQPIN